MGKWDKNWKFLRTDSWILVSSFETSFLKDYRELAKTLEILQRSQSKFLFWGVQNPKFHISIVKIHVSIVKNPITG